ncbi:MAG TPA: hypothetical protein VFT42_04480 [Solirubrobacteraceae bacterium]|nr:hypothetical protein [Solirubrobacteraceae bacterium]
MRRALVLWAVLFAAYCAGIGLHAAHGQDLSAPEAHTLLTADSIVHGRRGDLTREYRSRAWQPFYAGVLHPTARPVHRRLYEPQGVGFPLLISPAYAAGGRVGVELFLAALAALAFVLAAGLARRLVPEPYATSAALVTGLSPPAFAAATTIAPDAVAGAALAGAALLALHVRDAPRMATAAWSATLLAALPWLGVQYLGAGAVVAWALARWLRRRRRSLAGFVALEVVFFSAVVFITVNDKLFGGLTPDAASRAPDGPTGASGLGAHLARAPRLLGLWIDRDYGIVRWAPFALLAFAALWLLVRSRRARLARVVPAQIDVEVTAGFLAAACAAMALVAAFLYPTIAGAHFAGRPLVCVFAFGAALAAWSLRRFPRTGTLLAALTIAATIWLVAGVRLTPSAGVAPPHGPLPWAGAQAVLPRLR